MLDRELDIPTPDGSMNTFITHPEEGGPHPAVLFYMDAFGPRPRAATLLLEQARHHAFGPLL